MIKHRRAVELRNRVGKIFESFPEDVLWSDGPCHEYSSGIAEVEELYDGLQSEQDPEEIKGYHSDIRRAVQRAKRNRPKCVLQLRKMGKRLIERADSLPDPSELD